MRPSRIAAGAAVAVLLVVPLFAGDAKLSILISTFAVAIAALGLDLLVGSTGQLSLAHAAFLGVGCFTAINVGSRFGWPAAFVAAIVVTALAAAVAGLPSLRIRGLQVAITTLAFQVFAEAFLFQRADVTASGLTFERPDALLGFKPLYWFSLGCVALAVAVLAWVRRSRIGRSFVAVRDVEARAVAFGVRPGPTKLLAYALSGAVVGLGGALFAFKEGSVNTLDSFNLQASLLLVAVVVVGGARSSPGILLGAFAVEALPGLVPGGDFAELVPIGFAVMLVVSIVVQPEGIGGVLRRLDRGGGERPSPRAMPVDPHEAAERAAVLREVPRALVDRMPAPALLVAREVSVRYGGVTALADLDLEVRRGEIVGLIGANGAGKSTFFNAVSGLAPVTGSITYRGRELVDPASRTRSGIARTFQDMGLVRAQTVRENLLLAQHWLPGESAVRRRADVALELFGLDHLADEVLGGLPYGTMRLVEIAGAVAAGPDLLLLDEASAGLTPEEAYALGDRFLALRDELGLTLVVIEHHVPLIARVCDWCYCLESGRLIAAGAPAEVTAQPRVVESFLGRGALAR